jgi:hypothetical protein
LTRISLQHISSAAATNDAAHTTQPEVRGRRTGTCSVDVDARSSNTTEPLMKRRGLARQQQRPTTPKTNTHRTQFNRCLIQKP